MKRKRRESRKVGVTEVQRRELERLWFIYGNYGPKTTPGNHQFIQGFLERGQDERDFNKVTPECLATVDEVLAVASDSPLD